MHWSFSSSVQEALALNAADTDDEEEDEEYTAIAGEEDDISDMLKSQYFLIKIMCNSKSFRQKHGEAYSIPLAYGKIQSSRICDPSI